MENNFKRFLSLLLAFVMVISMIPMTHAHAAASVDGNAINMEVGDTHEITVNGNHSDLDGSGNEYVQVKAVFAPQMTDRTAALASTIEEGAKYVLVNTRLWKALEYTNAQLAYELGLKKGKGK